MSGTAGLIAENVPLNFGMLTVAADLIFVIWHLLEDNMPLIGGFCAALGVAKIRRG